MTRSQALPRLENSDHLTRAEFPCVLSPARADAPGDSRHFMDWWAGVYAEHHDDIRVVAEATGILAADNEVPPEACLFWKQRPNSDTVSINADNYIEGSPQLAIESAASSVRVDLGRKRGAYRRNRVAGYVVWSTLNNAIEWR